MDGSISGLLILPIFIFFFSGLWMFVLTLISFVGGWRRLAKQFPMTGADMGKIMKKFRFCSFRMSILGTYSNSINITLYERGVLFAPVLFFKFGHSPIFIPWEQIEDVEEKSIFFSKQYRVQANMRELCFYGNAGKEILGYYQHFLQKRR